MPEGDVPLEWHEGDVILGLYEVLDVVRTGGMGLVYRVRHRDWRIDLAVKTPRRALVSSPIAVRNFQVEAEAWVGLGLHPNVVGCVYVRTLHGVPRVFAEWVDGGSLAESVRGGHLYEGGHHHALRRMLDIAIQFAWGLEHAHEQDMIHQDVKPANVMLTPDGIVKVTDFGLARARIATEASSLVAGRAEMTPEYCSPEQAAPVGEARLSPATDVWSWAISVLELFVGEPPCGFGPTAGEVFAEFRNTGTRYPAIPALPAGLAALLEDCFRPDPADRPGAMGEIADALIEVYEEALGETWQRSRPDPFSMVADDLSNHALSLLDLGRTRQAEDLFEQALESDPLNPHAVYNSGLHLWRTGRASDAALVAELEAVGAAPSAGAITAYLLGLVHLERGDRNGAQAALEAGRQIPTDPADPAAAHEEMAAALAAGLAQGPTGPRLPQTLPAGSVTAVALSADGRIALSGFVDARAWELETGRRLCGLAGHGQELSSLALSADGRLALSGDRDGGVRAWELRSEHCLHVLPGHTGAVWAVALSADGSLALSGGADASVRVWDLATGRCVRALTGHQGAVLAVAVSADARSAVSGAVDGTLRVWDLGSGRCVRAIEAHRAGVSSVAMSTDGRVAVSSSGDPSGRRGEPIVRAWELSSGRCLQVLEGHTRVVPSVALSADGRVAISGSHDGTARVWEPASGRCVRVLNAPTTGSPEPPLDVALSANGDVAISSSRVILCRDEEHTVGVWDLPAGPRSPWSYSRPRPSNELDRTALVQQALRRAAAHVQKRDFAAAAAELRSARGLSGHERHPELIDAWWQAARGGRRAALLGSWPAGALAGHAGSVTSVAISAGGERALSGGDDGRVRLWEPATRRCLRAVVGHTDMVSSIAISSDGRRAVSCAGDPLDLTQARGDDAAVRVWDLETGRCLHTLTGHNSGVLSVALSPDGRLALSGSSDRTARLWDLDTGRCLRTVTRNGSGVVSVALSTDGRLALLGGDYRAVPVVDLQTGRCRRTLKAGYIVTAVAVSADGQLALAGDWRGAVKVWELRTGRCLHTLAAHGDRVTCVAVSLDARFALSGSWDGTVRVWDLRTGECLRVLEGHTGWVYSVALSPNGRRAMGGGDDGTARVWELDWDYEFPAPADWDEGARPHLQASLATSRARAHTRCSEEEIQQLLGVLEDAGYGWLRERGVRAELQRMASGRGRRLWRWRHR